MPLAKDTGVPTSVIQSLSIVYRSVTPALAGQLVDWAGNLATNPTGPIMGVLQDDAIQNSVVSVAMSGVVEILSTAAFGIGSSIGTDSTGRGTAVGAGSQQFARAMSATTGGNQKFQAYITREGLS